MARFVKVHRARLSRCRARKVPLQRGLKFQELAHAPAGILRKVGARFHQPVQFVAHGLKAQSAQDGVERGVRILGIDLVKAAQAFQQPPQGCSAGSGRNVVEHGRRGQGAVVMDHALGFAEEVAVGAGLTGQQVVIVGRRLKGE